MDSKRDRFRDGKVVIATGGGAEAFLPRVTSQRRGACDGTGSRGEGT
jgi:hypothetical protein